VGTIDDAPKSPAASLGAVNQGGALVDMAMLAIAEHLTAESPDEPETTVVDIVTECAHEQPDGDPLLVEQAARARLEARRDASGAAAAGGKESGLDGGV